MNSHAIPPLTDSKSQQHLPPIRENPTYLVSHQTLDSASTFLVTHSLYSYSFVITFATLEDGSEDLRSMARVLVIGAGVNGGRPYRDFLTLYGSAQFYLLAALVKLLGVSALVAA